MSIVLTNLARRIRRFIWIAGLSVLSAVAVVSLLLIPVSFVAPFAASASVSHEVVPPMWKQRGTGATFDSYCSIAIYCGSGGAYLLIDTCHYSAPKGVTEPLEFGAFVRREQARYPGLGDNVPPNIVGLNWLGAHWHYRAQSWHLGERMRKAYLGFNAPLPLIALGCGLLPAIRLVHRRRREKLGQGFPLVTHSPASSNLVSASASS